MTPRKSSREAVVEIYANWLRVKFRVDVEAFGVLEKSEWTSSDRALFLELLYGVIRRHSTLEIFLQHLSNGRLKVQHAVHAAVSVALYQLLYLDRIPDYAAVDTAVSIAQALGGAKQAGWVNAILRRAIREKEQLLNLHSTLADPVQQIACKFSYPEWMLGRWLKRMSIDRLETFLDWNNRRPGISVRLNRRLIDAQQFIDHIRKQEIEIEKNPFDPDFFLIRHAGDLRKLVLIRDGAITVQDVSQGLVGRLVNPQPGETILDLCAAPGGKTTHMSELCPDSRITATDISSRRLKQLDENISRCRLGNVKLVSYDDLLASNQRFRARAPEFSQGVRICAGE